MSCLPLLIGLSTFGLQPRSAGTRRPLTTTSILAPWGSSWNSWGEIGNVKPAGRHPWIRWMSFLGPSARIRPMDVAPTNNSASTGASPSFTHQPETRLGDMCSTNPFMGITLLSRPPGRTPMLSPTSACHLSRRALDGTRAINRARWPAELRQPALRPARVLGRHGRTLP